MRKLFFGVILTALCIFSSQGFATSNIKCFQLNEDTASKDDKYLEDELSGIGIEFDTVDIIEIGVESKEIRVIQQIDEGFLVKTFSAATASKKNAIKLPFGKKGQITKIVFNPTWTPTKNIQKENVKKFGKRLPKTVLPGKSNPLGIVKLFITYEHGPNDLGIHNTNEPKSIGKRVSHGCNRLGKDDALELASLILEQNGYDAKEIIHLARNNPRKTLAFKIEHGPEVYYKKR